MTGSEAAGTSEAIASTLHIAATHPAFEGHFPGTPILPGVALLAEVLERVRANTRLAAAVGETPHINAVKFLAPVEPDTTLALEFRFAARSLRWRLDRGSEAVASGEFARCDTAAAP